MKPFWLAEVIWQGFKVLQKTYKKVVFQSNTDWIARICVFITSLFSCRQVYEIVFKVVQSGSCFQFMWFIFSISSIPCSLPYIITYSKKPVSSVRHPLCKIRMRVTLAKLHGTTSCMIQPVHCSDIWKHNMCIIRTVSGHCS